MASPELTAVNRSTVEKMLKSAIATGRGFGAVKPGFVYFNEGDIATYAHPPSL